MANGCSNKTLQVQRLPEGSRIPRNMGSLEGLYIRGFFGHNFSTAGKSTDG